MSIDKEKIQTAMTEALQDTFGDMAFLDVMPLQERPPELSFSQILYLEFLDPHSGKCLLYLPKDLKQSIVENIHADDWDNLSADERDDCLLEILNVIGGNFLRALYGPDQRFNMSFPTVIFDEQDIDNRDKFVDLYYDGEGIPFSVSVYTTGVVE